jgi:hypothetical protein
LKSENEESELRFALSLTILYSCVAFVYLVLPVWREFNGVLLGSRLIRNDPLLTSGTLEWGFRSLFSSTRSFFEWNAGFPLHNSLANSENLLGWQLIYYPLRLLGAGVPTAYNIIIVASLVISGVGAALLARRLGCNRWGAAVAGLIFGFGPYHLNNLMHIQTMAVCWIPFPILFLDRYMERPNAKDAFGLVAMFIVTSLSVVYFAVFLCLALPLYALLAWAWGRYEFRKSVALSLSRLGIVSIVAISPIAIPYVRFARVNGRYGASVSTLAELSMEWLAPLRTPSFQLMWAGTPLRWANPWDGQPAFFGLIGICLIVLGIIAYRRDKPTRAIVLTLVSLAVISFLLALGPVFKTAGRGPSRIVEWVPMPGRLWLAFRGIRNPSRFFFFAWLAGAVLAAIGLTTLQKKIGAKWVRLSGALIVALLIVEYWPAAWLTRDSVRVSSPIDVSDSYPFLKNETDTGGVIEFPSTDASGTRLDMGLYIYGASGHLRHVVALHGNRRIPVIDSLRSMGELLPSDSARAFLSSHGVTRVVVHRFLGNPSANEAMIAVFRDSDLPLLFNGRESAVFDLSGGKGSPRRAQP